MHTVFISYSTKDTAAANDIRSYLEGAGLSCWIAPRDIAPGEDFPTAIASAVSKSRIMVLAFSANANMSADVSRELHLANDFKVPIIVLRLGNVTPALSNRYSLADAHWLEGTNPPTREQIQSLIALVQSQWPDLLPGPGEATRKQGFREKLSSFLISGPMRALGHFTVVLVQTLLRTVFVTAAVLLVLGVVLALAGSFVMARYAEATLGEYAWDFSTMNPAERTVLSPEFYAAQVAPYIEQHTLRTISETSISFKSPNLVQLSGKVLGNGVLLEGVIYEAEGLPQVHVQNLNGLPIPVIDGIFSDGINRGLQTGWREAPVRIQNLVIVGNTLEVGMINK